MMSGKFRWNFRKTPADPAKNKPSAEPVKVVMPEREKAPDAVATKSAAEVNVKSVEAECPPRAVSRLVEGERPRSAGARTWPDDLKDALKGMAVSARPGAKPAAAAAALVVAAGIGYAGGAMVGGRADAERQLRAALEDATAGLRDSRQEIARLAGETRSVKLALDTLKSERAQGGLGTRQAQVFDRMEKAGQDNAVRIGRLSEQLDRVEKSQRDPARLAVLVERLDRIERNVQLASAAPLPSGATVGALAPAVTASAATIPAAPSGAASGNGASSAPVPPPKPAGAVLDVTQTGSIGDVKGEAKTAAKAEVDPRRVLLDGYSVRDIDDGYALLESKTGRFVEVAVGQTLPGVGRVEAIERRGRQWIVVTPKGYIAERWN